MASAYKYQADEIIKPYPVGGAASVHYDPADPKRSVLETSAKSGSGRIWAGRIMAAVPFLLIVLLWAVARYMS
jgi:hypothetical protein